MRNREEEKNKEGSTTEAEENLLLEETCIGYNELRMMRGFTEVIQHLYCEVTGLLFRKTIRKFNQDKEQVCWISALLITMAFPI